MRHNFIVIEGNIGSGKTSLSTKLSAEFDTRLILEEFSNNPFLEKFYEDSDRFAFQAELAFLAKRYQQLRQIVTQTELFHTATISDYLFYKSMIFARSNLPEDEYQLYTHLFNIIYTTVPKPDLVVYLYLSIDNLMKNIKKRGRSYEQEITADYLLNIQNSYFEFFNQQKDLKVLVIDTNRLDFVNRPEDYAKMVEHISRDYPVGIHRILGWVFHNYSMINGFSESFDYWKESLCLHPN